MLFQLGRIFFTPTAAEVASQKLIMSCLRRHANGDWGVLSEQDCEVNKMALASGGRLMSAYPIDPKLPCAGFGENCIWIITEADRSVTTVLLPDDY